MFEQVQVPTSDAEKNMVLATAKATFGKLSTGG